MCSKENSLLKKAEAFLDKNGPKFHGGLPTKIIKIQPTVAELAVKKHFPIVNANPYIPRLTLFPPGGGT